MPAEQTGAGMLELLARQRFAPLFATQFLGAFNDNVYKNALVVLLTFGIGTGAGPAPAWLITAAAGVFILPFFLLSATAGSVADKLERSRLIRQVKLGEIVIMTLGATALMLASVPLLLLVLFLMGAQSALFGPLKYAILPQHLAASELTAGNALVQMSTYLAILVGTLAGGLLVAVPDDGRMLVAVLVLLLAVAGYLASRSIPQAPAADPSLQVRRNPFAATIDCLRDARSAAGLLPAVLGVSWFWFVGATFLQLLPVYARDVLGGGPTTVTLLLTAFSVGIGVGAIACGRLAAAGGGGWLVMPAALGMAVFSLTPLLLVPETAADGATRQMLASGWPVLAGFLALAVSGGLYVVPLYVMVQSRSPVTRRARVIGAMNVLNSAFMVASALLTIVLLGLGVSVAGVLALTGLGSLVVAACLYRSLG